MMQWNRSSEMSEKLIHDHGYGDEDHVTENVTAHGTISVVEEQNQNDHEVTGGINLSLAEGTEEMVSLMKVTSPLLLISVAMFLRNMISLYFLGQLRDVDLAGGALGLAFGNATGFSVIKGLSLGMDPICSQAFGARRWAAIRQTYLKTFCLLLFVAIFISCLWLNADPLFLLLRQDMEITKVAKVYLACLIPELIAQTHLNPLRTFLKCQGKNAPVTTASICCVILHFPISYLFTIHFNLGVQGVALALACNTVILNISLVLYLILSDSPLKPWDRSTFQSICHRWMPLLRLALPSAVSVCLEWWCYEIILFLSGLLDNPQSSIAATGILIQTAGLLYNIPYSLSGSLSTLVGNAIGAGQPSRAQWTTIIGILSGFLYGIVAFMFTIAVRSVWGRMFTGQSQVLDLISTALPLLGLCEIGNGPQTAACGILTGTARPKTGARINACAFYLIGAPVAILLTFTFKVGYPGLWLGLASAQVSCICMMVYVLFRTDWTQQVKNAEELTTGADEKDEEDLDANLMSDSQAAS